ncbi:hypothetical protein GQ42DRAFT_14540 [Ramicandelaber brevisporus]|nr:hypothetical protein GQ42DRAFT_14540 [Ramicandelaber brevisporus]
MGFFRRLSISIKRCVRACGSFCSECCQPLNTATEARGSSSSGDHSSSDRSTTVAVRGRPRGASVIVSPEHQRTSSSLRAKATGRHSTSDDTEPSRQRLFKGFADGSSSNDDSEPLLLPPKPKDASKRHSMVAPIVLGPDGLPLMRQKPGKAELYPVTLDDLASEFATSNNSAGVTPRPAVTSTSRTSDVNNRAYERARRGAGRLSWGLKPRDEEDRRVVSERWDDDFEWQPIVPSTVPEESSPAPAPAPVPVSLIIPTSIAVKQEAVGGQLELLATLRESADRLSQLRPTVQRLLTCSATTNQKLNGQSNGRPESRSSVQLLRENLRKDWAEADRLVNLINATNIDHTPETMPSLLAPYARDPTLASTPPPSLTPDVAIPAHLTDINSKLLSSVDDDQFDFADIPPLHPDTHPGRVTFTADSLAPLAAHALRITSWVDRDVRILQRSLKDVIDS